MFHSTHRFFLTTGAIYVVMFRLDKPSSFDRVEYLEKLHSYQFFVVSFVAVVVSILFYFVIFL